MFEERGKTNSPRLIIASNRLPVQFSRETQELLPGSGGLVTALESVEFPTRPMWVGTGPSEVSEDVFERALAANADSSGFEFHALYPDAKTYDAYYNGISNDVLWPLFHYETRAAAGFLPQQWEDYKEINRQFAKELAERCGDEDIIWLHDFHLFLVPKYLRELKPNATIGFFLHIPFPSSEVFRQLPVRQEVLESLLDCDLVGFHDYGYLRHFCASLLAVLGVDSNGLEVTSPHSKRATQLGVFPISIDTGAFKHRAASERVEILCEGYRNRDRRIILGVDRLDYTKGIDLKLESFRVFLERYPDLRETVQLLQVAVPSRTEVPEYKNLRAMIEQKVGEINGEYGTPMGAPIQYLFRHLDRDELVALYRVANVLLVQSPRDGMNLVSLEYVASQDAQDPGVVCISEFAGASAFLSHAITINPWNFSETADQLYEAICMPKGERRQRHRIMAKRLDHYDSNKWAADFVGALRSSTQALASRPAERVTADAIADEITDGRLYLFLDFDGTLTPIQTDPEEVKLDERGRRLLSELAANPRVELTIVSGRNLDFLRRRLDGIPVNIAAEHGAIFLASRGTRPHKLVRSDVDAWKGLVTKMMTDFALRTPSSFVETKEFNVAWHFRESPELFGEHQARRLMVELEGALHNFPAQTIRGKKVIEVRSVESHKGAFCRWFLDNHRPPERNDLFVAIGDDTTDEDMFAALAGDRSCCVRVGQRESLAKYHVDTPEDVWALLARLKAELSEPVDSGFRMPTITTQFTVRD